MRKLILFSALGGAFALALVLEHLVARAAPERTAAAAGDRVVLQLGGGPPRVIPPQPADEPRVPPRKQEQAGTGSTLPGAGRSRRAEVGAPKTPPSGRTHVVAKHETLSTIARRELGSTSRWRDLATWNDIADPASLREGTVLRLDPPEGARSAAQAPVRPPDATESPGRSHKVAKGETLSRIAARYLGDAQRWREIQKLNGIADPANVAEGTVLRIPER